MSRASRSDGTSRRRPGKVIAPQRGGGNSSSIRLDRGSAEAAAADLPALDQQVLHSRPQRAEILHPLGRFARPHRVRHLMGQSGRTGTGRRAGRDYIRDGLQFALDTIETATGEKEVNAIGYCVGGTLLSAALALMAQEGDERIKSATLFTTPGRLHPCRRPQDLRG